MNQVQRQNDIIKLQEFLLQQENVNLAVSHYFSDGLYARELTIPAGVIQDNNGGNGWNIEVVPEITVPNPTPFHVQAIEYEVQSS